MKIIRQTQQELVVEESSMWIAGICSMASLPLFIAAVMPGLHAILIGACFLLLFALVWVRKTSFVFDSVQNVVRWNNRKLFKVDSGTVPFSDISDIGVEGATGRGNGSTSQLAILTEQGPLLMASFDSGRNVAYASLRQSILDFMQLDQHKLSLASAVAARDYAANLEPSIRSLLSQDRKIDAITLLTAKAKLSLAEATAHVDEIENAMEAEATSDSVIQL
jgi:hypothetical protein